MGQLVDRAKARIGRIKADRSTEMGMAGHQAAMSALSGIHADVSARNEAEKKDPWALRRTAGSTDYRTSTYTKDSEGNTFKNGVRAIRAGSKPRTESNSDSI